MDNEAIKQIKQARPEWSKFSDSQLVEAVHQVDYPDLTREQVAQGLGVKLEAPKAPEAEPRGMARAAADLGLGVTSGAITGVKMVADAFGADNAVSAGLGEANEFVQQFLSAQAKSDQQEQARILKEAEGKGVLEQVKAGVKAFAVAPGQTIAQGLGSAAPTIATAFIPGVGQAATIARIGAGVGLGATQGAGAAKGAIYDEVKRKALERGDSPDAAELLASQAQAYDGPNAAQIALSGGLGALAAVTGAEGSVRALRGGANAAQATRSMPARIGVGALTEAIPEAAQGGQEKFATNTALNNAGFEPVDPWAGVAANATLEGLAAAPIGGAFAALPNNGPLSRGANIAVDQKNQEIAAVAQPGQPAPGLSEGQYNQAMDGIMAQGDADMKALKQAGFMDKGPSAYANAAGAQAMGSPGVDPLAQSEQPFDALADRIMATRETLADEGNRQAIRQKFGQSALDEVLYYLNQADKPGQIPDQTRDNMLAMAEEIVSRSRLTPVQQPADLGADAHSAPERISAEGGLPQIGLDTEQTGVFRADAAGNVAPETNADRINTRQAAAAKKDRPQGGPGMDAMTPRDTMRGAGPGVMVGDGVLTPAERPARQQPAAGPVPRLVYRPNGEPFKNQRAAVLEQRRVGGEVVPVEGGWAVQTQGEADDVRSGETVGSAERTGADGAPDAVRSLGSDGRGPADGGVAVDERGGSSAGRDGAGVGRAGAVPDGSTDRGLGEALNGKTPAFLKTKTVPEMTDEELKQAQAFYGPNHKRAKTIQKEMAKRAPKVPAVADSKPSAPAAKQMTLQDMAKPLGDALREGGWSAFTKLREQFAGNNNLTVRQTLDLNDLTRAAVGVEFFNTEYAKADPEKAGRVAHSNGEAPVPPAGLNEDQKARWLAAWDEGKARKDEQEPAARQPGEVVGEAKEVAEAKALPDSRDATGKQASWVIREKATGDVVMETFDKKVAGAVNTEKYEAVPISEHLASLNNAPSEPYQPSQEAQDDQQVQGQAATEEVGASAADKVTGEKINDEWTAFSKESGTLGIPRDEMPQIKAEHRGALVNFLNARGIEHAQEEVDPATLKPTQAEFSPAKVEQAKAFTGGDRSILASEDSHVLDGHHQWMAKLEAGEPVKLIRLMAPIRTLLEQVKQFPSAEQDQASAQAPEQQDDAQVAQPEPQTEATDPQETPQITEAEARKRLKWRDLGQQDGTKTWGLYYDDGDGRGMRYGTVSKFAGSRWSVDGHDGGKYEGLQPAKTKAEDLAVERLRRDGYVTKDREVVGTSNDKRIGTDINGSPVFEGSEGSLKGVPYTFDERGKVRTGVAMQEQSQQAGTNQPNPFAAFDAVASEYGYTVTADGLIGKGDKFPGPRLVLKGGRLRIEGGSGQLLASYAGQKPISVGKFLESFWYAEKKPSVSEGASTGGAAVVNAGGFRAAPAGFDPKAAWDAMTPSQRSDMLDNWAGSGQTDMGGRYKDRAWESFNMGERVTLSAVLEAGAPVVSPDEYPAQEASRSYSGISHMGGSRAASDRDEFVKQVQSLYDEALPLAETDAQKKALRSAIQRFKEEYLKRTRRVISVRSGTYSGFVAGRSGLNSKQANNRNTGLDRALDDFYSWLKSATPGIKKAVLAARSPEQLAAEQAAKDAKAAAAQTKNDAFLVKLLNLKDSGEPLKLGSGTIEKVNYGRTDGLPNTLTISGDGIIKGVNDKINVIPTLYKTREALSEAVERVKAKTEQKAEEKPASKTPTVDRHMEVMESVRNGGGSLADYQESFAAVSENEEAVKAELTAKTKEELLRAGGAYFHMRYKGETKPEIIKAFYAELLEEYALGKSYGPNSYIMTGGGMAAHRQRKREALKVLVEGQTQEDLDNFAKEIAARRAENKAEREAKQAAMANPQTLSDFRSLLNVKIREGMTRAEAFLTLTPEQRIKYDELEAESTKESREAAKRAAKTAVRSAGQTTAGEIVATKHTRDGHDLWVVKLADRLSTDDYRTVLASAKRLGGSYSSFRGNGAIPGFQFRTPEAAQAFLKLAGGDTTEAQGLAEQRRDAFDDDRSQSAVERLREMADKLEERAQEALDRDRKTNTARRARFAAAADREAQEAKALAQTMRNIAQAIEEGRAKFLDGVRTRSQVELLRGRVVAAKQEELRVKHPSYADQEKRKGEPATAETADFAEFPTFSAFRSDLASLARQMLEVDGTKKLGQQLMSVADDVTDAYIDFAKKPENLHKLSTFSIRQGDDVKAAIFPSKDAAERAIRRSGLADRAIVLAEKRGVNRIIMSPSEAMSRGVWTGDGDKRITLTADAGTALVQAIGRRGNKTNRLTVPWQFQTAYDRLNALKRIGIETPSEYRSALREFIGLQERAIVNKVREMELAMTGRKNDGLDFFPTPAEVADQMVAAADIGPDMAVLEPSAGMGHIADRIREAGAEPDVIELADDRRELLQEKGYNLSDFRDFLDMKPRQFFTYGDVFRAPDGTEGVLRSQGGMGSNRVRLVSEDGAELGKFDRDELTGIRHRGTESGYDRIIMNPPFSNGRDIEHVMHAFDLLKPGGRIVAIMGESAFFNQSKKAEAFRQWLDDKGGTSEKLPAGSFMEPSLPVNTGVNARMVVIDKADSAGSASESQADAGFSRTTAQSTEEENALKALSENDDLFRLPKSEGTTVEAITSDNDPSIKVKKLQGIPGRTEYQFTMPNGKTARMVVRPANPYGANTYGFDYVDGETSNVLDVRPGDNPEDVDADKEDVWIDVSLLSRGQDGAKIYNIAATYAHNTGRIFIGDPAGLSDDALIRRPEQMLSSALKFGTTEHLAPHPRQITGDDRLGVPPLRWVYGDHVGNIKRLIDVNLKFAENAGVDAITFDPTDGKFRDSEGGDLGRAGIEALAVGAGYGRAMGAGADTLARGAVLRALLREEGGPGKSQVRGRDGLLARIVSVSAAHDEATKRVFYSREGVSQSESGDGSRRQNAIAAIAHMDMVEDLVKQLTKRWKNAPEIIVLRSMDEAPAAVRAENERQIAGGATGEPEAFYHQGKAYLLASHMRSMKDVRRAVFHEVLGHLGLRELYGSEMGAILDQVARARRQDVEAKAEQYGLDMSKARDVRAAAEEWLAEKAQENPQLGFVRRAIAAIRSWLRRNVPALAEMRMTDDDIVSELIIPVQRFIKRGTSAGGLSLVPSFSRDNAADRPMFSRSAATADFTKVARESVQDFFGSAGAQVDWLDRTFKTQYAKAQKFPEFGKVFNKLQDYIEGVSTLANEAADNAPSILPKLENWRDLAKTGLKEADAKAVAAPIFEGTLSWARVRGQLVPMDEAVSQGFDGEAGVVFTDKELRDQFKLTDEQIGYYREFRAAVDESLDQLVSTEVIRLLGDAPPAVKAMAMTREGRAGLRRAISSAFENQEDPLLEQINDKFDHIDRMKARGYAPLSRFGKFWVHVVDQDGQTQYFGMEESRSQANRLARTLREEFPGATVEQGVMSQEFHKLMSAVPVDAMELFASAIGADQSEVFQKYIQLAKNNRSTMKRLIKRKGTSGFSDDVPRVLASFVTSNARAASTALNIKDAKDLARDIRDGDVKDEAIKLIESVTEPEESGAAIRSVMFTNFIGGSIASAVVNVTQPFMMTLPYLSQWGGALKAGGRLVDAARMIATGVDESSEIGKALKRAENEGVVSPQEIHHLIDRAAGGIGSKNLYLKKLALLWSGPFSVAEQFNRRVSFLAAYQTAKAEGIANPFGFAEKAVIETQGLYNAGNKPNVARGAIGATAMTFKQYSIHYLEWLARMAKSGPDGKKAAALALVLLMMAAGTDGLPFMDDMDDVFDTVGQAMGYDTNTKRARREAVASVLGEELAEVATRGFSAAAGFPVDLSIRMGMGNLLPATDLLLKSNTDTARSLAEIAGPGGSMFTQYRDAARELLSGDIGGAIQKASPVALQNLMKAAKMAETGEYRDQRDRKVTDVDGLDVGMKALSFQPARIARESTRMAEARQSETLAKAVENEITDKWARAIADGDREAEKEALKMRDDWNEKNPEQPIVVKRTQAVRKAKNMKLDRRERFLKTVAPERRALVDQEIS